MNIFDKLGFKVILDYGHNPAAVQAMCTLVDGLSETGGLSPSGKRVCVVAAPGDRRNEDIKEIAEIVSGSFDLFICREDDRKRGREPGEVATILKDSLLACGISEEQVHVISSEVDAVDRALELCNPGDLLLIFADKITRSWKQIIYHHSISKKPEAVAEKDAGVFEEVFVEQEIPFSQDERGVFVPHEEQAD